MANASYTFHETKQSVGLFFRDVLPYVMEYCLQPMSTYQDSPILAAPSEGSSGYSPHRLGLKISVNAVASYDDRTLFGAASLTTID